MLLFSGSPFVKEFFDLILSLQSPGLSPDSSDLRRETDVHKLKVTTVCSHLLLAFTVYAVDQLHSCD